MPGVLMIEAMAQTGGVLWFKKNGIEGKIALLAGVDGARFRGQVVPGDQMIIEARFVKKKAQLLIAEANIKVEGKVVCEAKLMYVVED
jgi:3-hydroxyacyl-[acyl-carrier-protein] dehydratase